MKNIQTFFFIFHSTTDYSQLIQNLLSKKGFKNCEVISDEIIKSHILKKSIFAILAFSPLSIE